MTTLAIIGGTGLARMPGLTVTRREMVKTPFGAPSCPLVFGEFGGAAVAFLARHGSEHRIPPHRNQLPGEPLGAAVGRHRAGDRRRRRRRHRRGLPDRRDRRAGPDHRLHPRARAHLLRRRRRSDPARRLHLPLRRGPAPIADRERAGGIGSDAGRAGNLRRHAGTAARERRRDRSPRTRRLHGGRADRYCPRPVSPANSGSPTPRWPSSSTRRRARAAGARTRPPPRARRAPIDMDAIGVAIENGIARRARGDRRCPAFAVDGRRGLRAPGRPGRLQSGARGLTATRRASSMADSLHHRENSTCNRRHRRSGRAHWRTARGV